MSQKIDSACPIALLFLVSHKAGKIKRGTSAAEFKTPGDGSL